MTEYVISFFLFSANNPVALSLRYGWSRTYKINDCDKNKIVSSYLFISSIRRKIRRKSQSVFNDLRQYFIKDIILEVLTL